MGLRIVKQYLIIRHFFLSLNFVFICKTKVMIKYKNSLFFFILFLVGCVAKEDVVTTSNLDLGIPTFTARSNSTTTMQLEWLDTNRLESGFEIEMCSGEGCNNFAPIPASPVGANATSQLVGGLSGGEIYRFRIRAITESAGAGEWIESRSIVTLPAVPTNFNAGDVTDTTLNLTWTDTSNNELYFEIQKCRGLNCSSFSVVEGSPVAIDRENLSLTNLSPNNIYGFRIRSVSREGNGDWAP